MPYFTDISTRFKSASAVFSFTLQLLFSMINGVLFCPSLMLLASGAVATRFWFASVLGAGILIISFVSAKLMGRIFRERKITPPIDYLDPHHPIFIFLATHSLLVYATIPFIKRFTVLPPEIHNAFFFFYDFVVTHFHFFTAFLLVPALFATLLFKSQKHTLTATQKNLAIIGFVVGFFALQSLLKTLGFLNLDGSQSPIINSIATFVFGPSLLAINLSIIFPIGQLFPNSPKHIWKPPTC